MPRACPSSPRTSRFLVVGLACCLALATACGTDPPDTAAGTTSSTLDENQNLAESAETDADDREDFEEQPDDTQPTDDQQADAHQNGDVGNELVDRLTTALVAIDSDEVPVDEDAARCAAEGLRSELSSDSYEVLVIAVEADTNFDDDDAITNAEVRTISESFVACINFDAVDAELDEEIDDGGALINCLRSTAGDDFVTTENVYALLNEQRTPSPEAPLLVEGLSSCPDEARPVVIALVVEGLVEAERLEASDCLAQLPDETLSEVVDGSLGPDPYYEAFVADNCPTS